MSLGAPAETILVGVHDALIVVDVQRDFLPDGALPVPEGEQVIPVIDRLVPLFGLRVYSRDWHPAGHVSFSAEPEFRDGSWPPHAVQGTPGADWGVGLDVPGDAILVNKGEDPEVETYSAFRAAGLDLARFLRKQKVERVFVTGLATDYCVRATAIDARRAGFPVFLVEDAVRGVSADSTALALCDMTEAGVIMVASSMLEA